MLNLKQKINAEPSLNEVISFTPENNEVHISDIHSETITPKKKKSNVSEKKEVKEEKKESTSVIHTEINNNFILAYLTNNKNVTISFKGKVIYDSSFNSLSDINVDNDTVSIKGVKYPYSGLFLRKKQN